MCGICGFVSFSRPNADDGSVLRSMLHSLKHRGPDESGYLARDGVALANARLSIIDVADGHQPTHNEDDTIHVVFNGEIYNQSDLRGELKMRGHRFASRADTEVLAHLYEEEGVDFLQRLNGMFAIALWDEPERRLVLARDRLGIKPLFYAESGGRLVFGSEIKALLQLPGFVVEADPASIDQYLALRYSGGTSTLFRGVNRLLPGQVLVVDINAGSWATSQYWEPWKRTGAAPAASPDEAAERVRELLDDAVRLRLMSDVPFGAFLSGGLDSSGIVALMARHMDEPVETFSIRFSEEHRLDEGEHALAVSRHCGTRHHEVDCTADRVELLPHLLSHFDEPFADPIIVPTHQVSELAAEHVKVILSGEGADELFGGYTRFVKDTQIRRLALLPEFVRTALARAASRVPSADALQRALVLAGQSASRRALTWIEAFDAGERRSMSVDATAVSEGAERLYSDCVLDAPGTHPLEQLLFCELRLRLPDCMLTRTDRMTMAVSLEGRTPFLDHRLVEEALWMPHNFKVKGASEKHVLKKALAPLLPEAIPRRKKQGLAVPFALWTRHGLEAAIRRILSPASVRRRGLFHPAYVASLLDRWGPNAARHSQLIWSLLCLELWFRMYVDTGIERLDSATPLSEVA
ncbi:MAG: asparagine synthase (glutamine-hydrolyzing) [Candidatus Latescibacterota bacterium]